MVGQVEMEILQGLALREMGELVILYYLYYI
jgi:hypothetical protein